MHAQIVYNQNISLSSTFKELLQLKMYATNYPQHILMDYMY